MILRGNRLWKLAGLAGLAAAMAGAAQAQFATTGPLASPAEIIERRFEITDRVDMRMRGEVIRLKAPRQGSDAGIHGEQMEFRSLGAFLDARPFQNSFVISGGVYTGDETRNEPVAAVGQTVSSGAAPADLSGNLQMAVKGEAFAPYLGLGFDTTHRRGKRWGVKVMAGTVISGTPEVAMTARGGAHSGDAIVLDELEQARALNEGSLEKAGLHPVVQVGLTYRF